MEWHIQVCKSSAKMSPIQQALFRHKMDSVIRMKRKTILLRESHGIKSKLWGPKVNGGVLEKITGKVLLNQSLILLLVNDSVHHHGCTGLVYDRLSIVSYIHYSLLNESLCVELGILQTYSALLPR